MEERTKFEGLHAYVQAANYLSAAQIYLKKNVRLRNPLKNGHLKPHQYEKWSDCSGLNFVYAHINRMIIEQEQPVIFLAGDGHARAALIANTWLEGSYSSLNHDTPKNMQGLEKLVCDFSRPGAPAGHAGAHVPGYIHTGGEPGSALAHAFGAVLDHPDLMAVCMIDEDEVESDALSAAWHSIHFLNTKTGGTVLPVLHLNGGRTVLGRLPDIQLEQYFSGLGFAVFSVNAQEHMQAHRHMAQALDKVIKKIRDNKKRSPDTLLVWPMLILRTSNDWKMDQPFSFPMIGNDTPEPEVLERWLRSFQPDKYLHGRGGSIGPLREIIPSKARAMGMQEKANARHTLDVLKLPNRLEHALDVPERGTEKADAMHRLSGYLREVFELSEDTRNFRLFCPEPIHSMHLDEVFKATSRTWSLPIADDDRDLAPDGRIMEFFNTPCCEGWLEGYLLTGRHGLFCCNETFAPALDSMLNSYAEWLTECGKVSWRKPRASLNILLTSHAWQQDEAGDSHQDSGFITSLIQKKKEYVRIYLPPDAHTLLCTVDHCLRSQDDINLVISGSRPMLQWLDVEAAADHFQRGASIWLWAGQGELPDIVLACAGDTATQETLAADQLLRKHLPDLAFQVVNIIDLMSLALPAEHPHGLNPADFEGLFTADKPVIFAFHGDPCTIRELIYDRPGHRRFHVHGYIGESGSTPFDRVVRNETSRYDLALDVLQHLPSDIKEIRPTKTLFEGCLEAHHKEIRKRDKDCPEIQDWTWQDHPADGVHHE